MVELSFTCLDVRPERFGAGPRLLFRVGIAESAGRPIHSIALRCQVLVDPQRRDYAQREEELLESFFGGTSHWGDAIRPMRFGTVFAMVPAFVGSTEIELPMPCTYDMEVSSGRYLRALEGGAVPLTLQFSGTVSGRNDTGFWVEQMSWDRQATYAMPVEVWTELMELHFPGSSWLRFQSDTVDALVRYRARHSIDTWDLTIDRLLKAAGEW